MATPKHSPDVEHDILTCSICLETFRNPKYLPCLHTFCEICLTTYITSGLEKGNVDSIECPICRSSLSKPKVNITPEEWVKVLPVNFLILELLENQKIARQENICMLCERLAVKVIGKAEFICIECSDTLCESCKNYHCSMKFTSDHEVKRLEEFREEDKIPRRLNNTCPVHPAKVLELFCADHEIPCCCICIAIDHRKCEKVQTIEEAAEGLKESDRLQSVRKDLGLVAADLNSLITSHKSSLAELENQYREKLEIIEDTFENLRKTVNIQESNRKAELTKIFNEKKDEIETNIVIIENRKKTVDNDEQIITVGATKASQGQTLIEMSKIRKQVEVHKTKVRREFPKPKKINLILETADSANVIRIVSNTCVVKCESEPIFLSLNCSPKSVLKFNRFAAIGTEKNWWVMRKERVDAISFQVSEEVHLVGFLSYAPKDKDYACTLKAEIIKGGENLTAVSGIIEKKTGENKLVEVRLEKPINILPNTKYDILFVISSNGLCNYGIKGRPELLCEGVTFSFNKSEHSTNGTGVNTGQIPGLIFTKL